MSEFARLVEAIIREVERFWREIRRLIVTVAAGNFEIGEVNHVMPIDRLLLARLRTYGLRLSASNNVLCLSVRSKSWHSLRNHPLA